MERNFAKEACMKFVLLYSANIQHTNKHTYSMNHQMNKQNGKFQRKPSIY